MIHSSFPIEVMIFGLAPPLVPPKPVQFVKFVCIFCVQYFLTLPRQFIQVRIILLLWKFSFRIIRQRTHSRFSNDCQAV